PHQLRPRYAGGFEINPRHIEMPCRKARPCARQRLDDGGHSGELEIISCRKRAPASYKASELAKLRKAECALDVVRSPIEFGLAEFVIPGILASVGIEGVGQILEIPGIARHAVTACPF